MGAIFGAVRSELHPHQGLQVDNTKGVKRLRLGDIRGRQQVIRLDLLAGEHEMHRVPRLGRWSVQKHVDARGMAMHEPRSLESRSSRLEIGPADQEIHVLRVADRSLIHT